MNVEPPPLKKTLPSRTLMSPIGAREAPHESIPTYNQGMRQGNNGAKRIQHTETRSTTRRMCVHVQDRLR